MLVVVDAFSRWEEVAALKDKYAATVADALVETVFTNTTGHPKLVVSDQGSEFKGDLKAAMEMLRVTQRYTAAYRSEGHVLAQRFNRSLSDTLESMVTQEDPEWHKALPWAKLAYNSAIHAALSMEGEGISPAEVHLGRRMHLNMEAGLEPWSAAESSRKPSEYAQQLSEHVKATCTTAWVAECRRKYNANMRRLANKRGRKVQEFSMGQLVKLQAVETKGVERKILRLFNGPYEVVGKDSPTEYSAEGG